MNILRSTSHQDIVVASNKEALYGTCGQRVEILETV